MSIADHISSPFVLSSSLEDRVLMRINVSARYWITNIQCLYWYASKFHVCFCSIFI